MSEEGLHFAHSEFANLMWVWAVLVLLLVWLERRGNDALDKMVGGALQDQLVIRPSRWRRWARIGLLGISGFAMITALMQPQWGLRYVATPRVGAEIMIALDVSRSMLADDAKPSRLERAKAEISDLLSYLDDDYVGLIAFAGRASVLSPMTPDKSFLRLALDSAGPHSVTRGGTRLAEPILRAVAGMGEPGPAERALILITDGEDHDSFAIDAARVAAEAGIKIIAIGFGDEAGSQIYLRDPKTGARSLLRDGEGRAVISRLNGDLLREIALTTDGAFVPAGTGVLDLASIYEAHIADLTQGQLDDRGRTIRDEAYQFFVLLAIVSLIAAVSTSAGSRRNVGIALSVMLMLSSITPPSVSAQDQSVADSQAVEDEPENLSEDPREKFNRANEALGAGDPVAAMTLLRDTRRDATDDASLRYAATYNLGMAVVARADTLRGENPSAALDALYEAADWFREAAALMPTDEDPRHNLDVTLRRSLILADEIAQKDRGELDSDLDKMIDAQRTRVMHSAVLLEKIVRSGELDAAEIQRPAFRELATGQRLVLAEASALAERAARERELLLTRAEAEMSTEDVLRSAQLEAVLSYLDSAIDRMGQTRRQLRQRRAERAYRRGSDALAELKRARDQLRDPVAQIGILLAEVERLAQTTAALSTVGSSIDSALPVFLTRASAEADSGQIQVRVEELAERFSQAAEQARREEMSSGASNRMSQNPDPNAPEPVDRAKEEAQRLALRKAAPLVARAADAMARTTDALGVSDYRSALEQEARTWEELSAAREYFFDFSQLLNATYARQEQLTEGSRPLDSEEEPERDEFAGTFLRRQQKNQARALRLEDLLVAEESNRISRIEAENVTAPGAADVDPVKLERQRFDLARQRLALASGAMMEVMDALERKSGDDAPIWPVMHEASERARAHLNAIRTLFFSIAEHIRELALDQVEVRDQTLDAFALSVAEAPPDRVGEASSTSTAEPDANPVEQSTSEVVVRESGPETKLRLEALVGDQQGLESRAGAISDSLFVQSEEMAAGPAGEASPDAEGADDDGTRIRLAAEHVASAALAMVDAIAGLKTKSAESSSAPEAQTLAVDELHEALALLSPPPPPPSDEQESDEDDSKQNEESEPDEAEPESGEGSESEADDEEPGEEGMDDPSQLLQGVRDRDAERRQNRDRAARRRRAEPVEMDW